MVQLASAASVVPQAFDPVVTAKSPELAPPIAMLVIFRVAFPLLLSVAACDPEVAPETAVKLSELGVRVAMGAGGVVPVPVSVTDCVVGLALSVTVRVAVKAAAEA